jgi:hypothetical protein
VRDEALRRPAQGAEVEGGSFLGSALAAYQRRRGLADAALAAELGVSLADLDRMRLRRRPEGDGDYAAIAGRFGCDAQALRRIVAEAGEVPPGGPS